MRSKKNVKIRRLEVDKSAGVKEDMEFWSSRMPGERIAAMATLRMQWYKVHNERPTRLRRIFRIIKSQKD